MKKKLRNTLYSIGEFIIDSDIVNTNNFLLPSGKTGESLFLYHCGNYLKDEKFIKYSYKYFEESFLALNNYGVKFTGKTLFGGYTGILWLYQYYINTGFIESDEDSNNVFNVFDELIRKEFIVEKETKNYDLLYGLLGYGVYFLERNKFVTQAEVLKEIVDILEEIAIKKEYGITWEDKFDRLENKDKELINLGFAHGIPSIIVFLSYVYKETGNKKALTLINKTVDYLQYHELDVSKGSCFSFNIIDGQPDTYPSRLAWCYGDLGIGYAILKSGILTSNNYFVNYGKKIINNLTNLKIDDNITAIKDAGFCHGTSGVSHLFFKSFQYTGEMKFYNSSKYWIENSLKKTNPNGGYSRYNYLNDEEKWAYELDNGLLEGGAGIGLCMLSHLDTNISHWDLCFLL